MVKVNSHESYKLINLCNECFSVVGSTVDELIKQYMNPNIVKFRN